MAQDLPEKNFNELLKSLEAGLSKDQWQVLMNQSLRELARTDIFAFGEYVFGLQPAAHHREMVGFLLDCLDNKRSGVVLEPRGHAKTTWGNTILLSWLIGRYPNLRVGLISNTSQQADAFSRAIRWTLQANDRYKEVFGDAMGTAKWTDKEWLRAGSVHHGSKDVTVLAAGAGGAILGKRFDLILCDDILDEENTLNIDQREKVETWFWKTLKPTLVPGGTVLVLGTRWAEDDLYESLITSEEEEGKGWPAIVRAAIKVDDEGGETALWPEVWPLEALYEERRNMGSDNFACSYLNDISGLRDGTIFRREWFQYYDRLPEDREYTITMGIDLASSERERADYTARAIVAEDEDHNHYIMSVYRTKIETGHRGFVIDGFNAAPKMSRIVIENNQFQSTLVQDLLNTTALPVVGRKAEVDKRTRARAAAARYESHKVYHHKSLRGSDFETELLSFPKGHDDMVDAMGHAMNLLDSGMVFGAVRR
jgi:predicted phage terminase large subunit-like protein